MVPLAEAGTPRGVGFEHEFEEPLRHASASINWLDVDLGSGTPTRATSWDNGFHKCTTLCPPVIMLSHETTQSRKKAIPLLAPFCPYQKGESLSKALPPQTALVFHQPAAGHTGGGVLSLER